MKKLTCIICLLGILLTACSSDMYRNVYEGIKNNNDVKRTPSERAITPSPGYDEYKKERDQQQ